MADIWPTRDRFGRDVFLTREGRSHIVMRHAVMADRLNEVRTAIEHPDRITRDIVRRHRENHYLRTTSEPGWIKVVVQYRPVPPQGTWEGDIITAYPVRRPKPKEERLWP